jgi:hypothetical protein
MREVPMKKPTRSSPYEEKSEPMRDLNIDLENPDDDEIIELEDIIEMPDSPIDEDEDLDLDVVFDVDKEPVPEPKAASRPPVQEQAQMPRPEKEDLIESLGGEPEEEDVLFEPAASGQAEESPPAKGEPLLFDEGGQSLLDELISEPATPVTGMPADAGSEVAAWTELAPDTAGGPESLPSRGEDLSPAPAGLPDISQTAEELISRIEFRLQEHIRVAVESRLPDVVRSIINEEIEKLKKELK